MLSQRWNHFLVWSANNEMRSSYAQPGMKFVQRMLSIFWMMFLKWVVISSYAEHARKLVTRWLSMHGNWLLVGWAWAGIGYSLAGHKRKLVTRWLSIRGNSFLLVLNHVFTLSSIPLSPFPVPCLLSQVSIPIPCSLSHVSVPFLPSSVPCLTSLFLVSRPLSPILMSHFFVSCLPPSVPFFTSLFLVSCPLFSVSLLCSLSPVLCSLSHFSVPCFRPLVSCLPICSLYPILSSMSHFFVPCLPSSVPILRLCSLCPVHFPQLKSLFLLSHPPF
jgi:hypothetical protein